ncbi:chromosomal replication initiator protein DnaA [Orientia tsutsugamushi]|uniref:Chromosomal replication initiator protein DnaA n=2 Tax=Orientia tsutsugamushi TaxID=784 RepID=B3CUI4_ORITI|nr:chromosomal replication initiator protein DnaA [Orientia tsutsugamushi]KJV56702.1 chromosomal replication initiator protein DnaA [Orientia tsutsugamushi str. Kato PP]BAG41031.1 chromosomal replication initiator protein DnaA [Orientia tsutsugamushi str. Ikeda]SPR02206.1 chromosomal replication initiation protein DnaA [Orientia tsutsugamushi]
MNTLLQQQNTTKDGLYFHELWSNVKRDLRHHYGEAVFKSWFSKMNMVDFTDGYIKLSAPTNFTRDWIKANYFDSIRQLLAYYDSSITSIDIVTSAIDHQNSDLAFSTQQNTDNNNNQQYSTKSSNNVIFSSTLDPRFTFDNFVVGRPNELAYAAATTVAESPTAVAKSNPLFLYGGVGLGKTHLMHAIAWHIQNSSSKRKVIYMSAEKFMYQFVQSLRNKDVMSFKEQFRSVDVLMIDDIQFICGKDSTQEEFFHTFNALIDNKRQMVISCDRSPSDLDNIEERIKSRLGWGLVADVHSTTYELRLGILQSKVEQLATAVPLKVLEFLAAKITSNVRELEGALNKVIAHSTLVGYEITIENTQEILRDLLRSNQKTITIDSIQKKVAERYNIKISDMSSSRRSRSVTRPRQLAMYLAKRLTSKSLVDIGKAFGKKDHTTVMHAIKTVEDLSKQEQEFEDEVRLLMRILQN